MITLASQHGGATPVRSISTKETLQDMKHTTPFVSLDDVLAAKTDLWGDAAMRQPDGATAASFRDLLPPLRYVNAAFRHYPIVLSAPRSETKVRFISNGSAINARGNLWSWKDRGTPIVFFLNGEEFGADLARVEGPKYVKGYLPIVQLRYRNNDAVYAEEVFAPVSEPYGSHGTAFVRFTNRNTVPNEITASIDSPAALQARGTALVDAEEKTIVRYGNEWQWNENRKTLTAHLSPGRSAYLATFTTPITNPPVSSMTAAAYSRERRACERYWQGLLDAGMQIRTPERSIDNAWRSLIIGTLMLAKGDELEYSYGNVYEQQFEAECGDALTALLLYGQQQEARSMLMPLLRFEQNAVGYHTSAFKLQMLAQYYWLTRDTQYLSENDSVWRGEIDRLMTAVQKDTGLLPTENYCGDITDQVHSLNSNANTWRGLRDIAAVLSDIGDTDQSTRIAHWAIGYRAAVLAAAEKSIVHTTQPPFIPVALFGKEMPEDILTSTTLGSYWCLVAPYLIGSGIFAENSDQQRWLIEYLQQHGGVALGMIRFDQHSGVFANEKGLDDLYTLRYGLALLRRDDVDRAQVTLYGKLTHGMTRDTFIDGEGSSLVPLDHYGRPTYLPPDSSGNAFFLQHLRYTFVQDWDLDDDGKPDTLRLMFATPPLWLADGKEINIEHAPTAFGDVSVRMCSALKKGTVTADVTAPRLTPRHMLLRARVPTGWKVTGASIEGKALKVDSRGTVDLTGRTGKLPIVFTVKRNR